MAAIKPFQNESDAIEIGELTIENRLDRIELYGSLQLTRDKAGLALAKQLKDVIDKTIKAMQSRELPDHITNAPTDTTDNPFSD
jgi:hypothetical protein